MIEFGIFLNSNKNLFLTLFLAFIEINYLILLPASLLSYVFSPISSNLTFSKPTEMSKNGLIKALSIMINKAIIQQKSLMEY